MKRFLLGGVDSRKIVDNPGSTLDELREQVKTLASIVHHMTEFLDQELVDHVFAQAERKCPKMIASKYD
jgi:hypothetical protein